MITVLTSPQDLRGTRNPIYYEFATDNVDVTYIVAEIWVETAIYENDFVQIDTLNVAPDLDLKGKIYIHEVLEALLEYELPTTVEASAIYKCKKTALRYKLVIYEFTDVLGTPQELPIKWAIKGGFQYHDFAERGTTVMPANRFWLTSQSLEREMTTQQLEFLYFLPNQTLNNTIGIQLIGDSASFTHSILVAFRRFEPVVLPCGMVQGLWQNLVSFAIKRIVITAFGQSVIFNIKNKTSESFTRNLFYFNSLGGLDSLITQGESEVEQESNPDFFQRYVPDNYKTSTPEFLQLLPEVRRTVKVATGYKRKKEILGIADMIQSTARFEYIDNAMKPILLLSKKVVIRNDGEMLNFAELEYQYANIEYGIKPIE